MFLEINTKLSIVNQFLTLEMYSLGNKVSITAVGGMYE